jgi:hypothetical protein
MPVNDFGSLVVLSSGDEEMIIATEPQSDATWLLLPNPKIEAVNPRMAGPADELKLALNSGVPVLHDPKRQGFYDVELQTGWAYIHVREDSNTVHLIAYSPSGRIV